LQAIQIWRRNYEQTNTSQQADPQSFTAIILRFKAVTQSLTASILLSAVIFSLGHGYEGSAGVRTVGFMGSLFSLVYVWRQSLIALMVMHFLQDFISIILLPILGMK
jgi:membrane protease YdiL (CAAX protease family)